MLNVFGTKYKLIDVCTRVEPEGNEQGLLVLTSNKLDYIPLINHPYKTQESVLLSEVWELRWYWYKNKPIGF